MLYQITTQDLAFFKGQQWTLTNYTLLVLAAVVGIPQLSGQATALDFWRRLILCLIATVVGNQAICTLWHLKSSIDRRHERLQRIFASLSMTFQNARGPKPPEDAKGMTIFLTALIIIGLLCVWWLVLTNFWLSVDTTEKCASTAGQGICSSERPNLPNS